MTRIALICVVILALVELSAFATSNDTLVVDYTPYLNGHSWPRVPVVTYVESTSNLWVHPTAPNKFPTVQEIHDKDSDFTTVVLRFSDGTVHNNPGIEVHWDGSWASGYPVIDAHDPTIHDDLVKRAAAS